MVKLKFREGLFLGIALLYIFIVYHKWEQKGFEQQTFRYGGNISSCNNADVSCNNVDVSMKKGKKENRNMSTKIGINEI